MSRGFILGQTLHTRRGMGAQSSNMVLAAGGAPGIQETRLVGIRVRPRGCVIQTHHKILHVQGRQGTRHSRGHLCKVSSNSPEERNGLEAPTPDDSIDIKPSQKSRKVFQVALATVMVVMSAIVNRILYKMALIPLENYVFFLAQFQTFSYVFVYAAVLWVQHKRNVLDSKAWEIPVKFRNIFIGIGFVEAISSLLSFIGAAKLPGVMVPLLSQTILLWQVVLIYTILRKSMSFLQLCGVFAVVGGVALAAWPGGIQASVPSLWSNVDPKFAILYVFSCLFPALDTLLKDRLFRKGKEMQEGRDVDLFVVNTFGSASQAFFVFLLLPFVTSARGIPLHNLGDHLSMGWECFRGLTPACGSNCSGAPFLPVMYVLVNLIFNISALNLIGKAGNIALSLVMSGIVPLTMWAFTLPLPFLGAPPQLGINFVFGTTLLTCGLLIYNSPLWLPKLRQLWYNNVT
jgi:drug/metabolite transporter (DMT)-like permease